MSPTLQSPANQPGAGPSVLAGGPDTGGEGAAGGETSALRETVSKLRAMEMELMETSKRFPAAAASLRQATTGIRAALRQVIASPGAPEPKAPNVAG